MQPPVRIKLYGLISMTRRGYLIQMVIGGVLLAGLLALRLWLPEPVARAEVGDNLPPVGQLALWVLRHLHWIAVGLAVLFGIEACVVLRRFARAEAALQKRSPTTRSP